MKGQSLLLLGLLISGNAFGEVWAVATLGSHHFTDEHFNQHNYGSGFEYQTSDPSLRATGGFYDNSLNRTSVYGGVNWLPMTFFSVVKVGLIGGVISGYSHPLLPLVLPTVQFEYKDVGFNVFYAPKIKDGANVLGFQFKWKELMGILREFLFYFAEWEGPEEEELNDAARSRNLKVRVYEDARAALAKAKS